MVSYKMDKQLKKELAEAIKGEKYYHSIKGIITLSGIDSETGLYLTELFSIKGEFKKEYVSDDGEVKWACRFEGKAAPVGTNALTQTVTIVEFPINRKLNPRQIARSMALNLGVIFGFEI